MSHFKPSSTFINYALLLGVGLVWGVQYLINKLALEDFSISMIAASRVAIGALLLTLLLTPQIGKTYSPRTQRSFWSFLPEFIIIGFFEETLPWTAIIWAQQQLPNTFAAVLVGTVPLLATFLEVFFVKNNHVTKESTIAIVIGLLGILVLVGPKIFGSNIIDSFSLSLPGPRILALFIAALSFSISILLIKIRLGSKLTSIKAAHGVFTGALVTALPLFLFVTKPWITPLSFHCSHPGSHCGFLSLILLGTLCGGFVYIFYVKLIVRAGPSFASTANYIGVTISVFIGIFYYKGNSLTFNVIGGVLLILIAFWLLSQKCQASEIAE